MVGDGKTGFVVQLNNVKMMAERIIRILRNDNLRKVMSSNARQQALMRFHPDIVAQKTIHAYETIHSGFKNDQNV
jgi:glycosyltransferase involved in cell wall biosynthesis